ncbi:glycosyltransferase family 4 protein [Kitasatospora sp. NPDC051853]|uniref:glycosyltransferase family 4 protein n=1 Tax=Kitasatospora sp. NPDC051853 TaxID=3364058 RepID=UPI0037A40B87
MKILMLSWEYPPVLVGGLGRHVHALATSLVKEGHEITVVTRYAPGHPLEEWQEGVRVVHAMEDPPLFAESQDSFLAWTMAFNHTLTRAALRASTGHDFDVVHAHDWLVAHAAVTLKEQLDVPLIATIHATEAGRHQGWLPENMNKSIHSVEWWLAHEACRLVVCSQYMAWEVNRLMSVPYRRMEVVANGVEPHRWETDPEQVRNFRRRHHADGPLVGFAGRLVYEKGVQDLIMAVPELSARHPGIKVMIAGDGPYRQELEALTRDLGVTDRVEFTGFLDRELSTMIAACDVMALPSRYEPFGMIALEVAAAGTPVAVASTGGMMEIIRPGRTGATFNAGDPRSLAQAVSGLLTDRDNALEMAGRAREMVVRDYSWKAIARQTAENYRIATVEGPVFAERQAAKVLSQGRPRIVVPEGNLL